MFRTFGEQFCPVTLRFVAKLWWAGECWNRAEGVQEVGRSYPIQIIYWRLHEAVKDIASLQIWLRLISFSVNRQLKRAEKLAKCLVDFTSSSPADQGILGLLL